jgi:oligopeptide/dipeptide ABC transporter ATP-binding protein
VSDLVRARGLRKSFRTRGGWLGSAGRAFPAVDGVDLDIGEKETVGLVGESGSGKSTLGRILVRLIDPDEGSLHFDGTDLLGLEGQALRRLRREFQIVFQDPYGSLNPRMRIGDAIGEPLKIHKLVDGKTERAERVAELLTDVGLDPAMARRYPHEFSGGQRQRVGIARAIACGPRFIVADEPVSALDAPVQAQIVNLLVDLQERLDLSYLFISHDLHLVRRVCSRIAVMYFGRVVEEAPVERLYDEPRHPYTKALLAATPRVRPGAAAAPAVAGEPPSQTDPPGGCAFHPRCPEAIAECSQRAPVLLQIGAGHRVACHRVDGNR